ncbi:MAG: ABC transporter permease [Olsenella sp.]|nr:ABC transporter permease [Olsenella sp.]
MLASFKTCILSLVRDKALLVWALAFPLVMTCIFMGMFSGIEDAYSMVGSTLGIVEDENYRNAAGLDETLFSLSGQSAQDHVADLVYYGSAEEAEAAADGGEIDAYITVDSSSTPELHVSPRSIAENGQLPATVVTEVLDAYVRTRASLLNIAKTRPDLFQSGAALSAFRSNAVKTMHLTATKTAPAPDVRYYYALLAMAAGLGASAAMQSVRRLLPEAGPVGARTTLASTPRWRMLLGTLLGTWLCEFACMFAAFLFMRFVAEVDFGDNAALVLLAIFLSTLVACAAGALLGTIPAMESGMVSGLTCLLSLFTGLYGPASQSLADLVESSVPFLAYANPLWEMTNCFYALLYYDTLDAFQARCTALVLMALAFFALASLRMRRISHEHL